MNTDTQRQLERFKRDLDDGTFGPEELERLNRLLRRAGTDALLEWGWKGMEPFYWKLIDDAVERGDATVPDFFYRAALFHEQHDFAARVLERAHGEETDARIREALDESIQPLVEMGQTWNRARDLLAAHGDTLEGLRLVAREVYHAVEQDHIHKNHALNIMNAVLRDFLGYNSDLLLTPQQSEERHRRYRESVQILRDYWRSLIHGYGIEVPVQEQQP